MQTIKFIAHGYIIAVLRITDTAHNLPFEDVNAIAEILEHHIGAVITIDISDT